LGQSDSVLAKGRELRINPSHGVLPLRFEFADLALNARERVGQGLGRVSDREAGGFLGFLGAPAK
jgi:hypothetical protein